MSQHRRQNLNRVTIQGWEVEIEDGELPTDFATYLEKAQFVDQVDINNPDGRFLFLGISEGQTNECWPSLVLAQKYQDAQQSFKPGILLLPNTCLLFVGAGERLLCYDLVGKRRLWEDQTDFGFWGWSQTGDFVLMSAELEFSVWDQHGKKLWSTFVEPPWDFQVRDDIVELDVMGATRRHRLTDGDQVVN